MEGKRPQGANTVPHPVLVYCFDERFFWYTGGKYQNTEIKYRLHTPKTIRFGRKYPLIVHLHGTGEAGSNNTTSLVHLHSALPVMIGPERQDFFMLVVQCPSETPGWSFRPAKDGTLDVLMAAIEHVVAENSIDKRRIAVTGISSGGWGTWELIMKYPAMFSGAVPIACGAPSQQQRMASLKTTPVWAFANRGEIDSGKVNAESVHAAIRVINRSGGSMAFTVPNHGRNARKPAMEGYFRWMLAQKRGSWFAPPPGIFVYNSPYSLPLVPVMYVLPFAIIVFFAWERICELFSIMYQSVQKWDSRF